MAIKQLQRLQQVHDQVGLSRSEIYRLMGLGKFPAKIQLGARAVAWDADEVQAWVQKRIAARDATKKYA